MKKMSPMRWCLMACAAFTLLAVAALGGRWRDLRLARQAAMEDRSPRLEPDYRDTTIPPNLSPLNFRIAETGSFFHVVARAEHGRPIELASHAPLIAFPEKAWRRLLTANKGGEVYFDIGVKTEDKSWRRFRWITNRIAPEDIDSHLIYRKIHPSHNTWSSMGIYQRDLRSFRETPVLENKKFGNDCCHCHALCNNNPANTSLDIRSSKYGNSLLLINRNTVINAAGTVGFSAWHPSGRLLACSFNKPRLLLHGAKNDMRDIVELEGWLGYFFLDNLEVRRIPGLSDDNRLLTFPCWSPDGGHLYFCSSPNPWIVPGKTRNQNYQEIKFDLRRVAYDIEHDRWGEVKTILAARDTGLSIVQPRVSPDGRWLTFGLCDYGCWATYHPESDLGILDLKSAGEDGRYAWRKMEINSTECESWHSWSSNSRWIVFSSKRGNPLFSRPYLAYVTDAGRLRKPLLVPQRDPSFYDSYLKTYTIPTLATGPFGVDADKLARVVKSPKRQILSMPPPRSQSARALEEANLLDPVSNDAGKQQ